MSQELANRPDQNLAKRNSFPKLTSFFDALDLIVERATGLASKSKELIHVTKDVVILLFMLLLVIQHLIHYFFG